MSNSDITLYNKVYDRKNDKHIYQRTYIKGVNYQDIKAVDVASNGIISVDKTTVFIPITADYMDKSYMKPVEFKKHGTDNNFTLENGDIIVKGIIDFNLSDEKGSNMAYLKANYDDVMTITKVNDNRFGSASIQHFEVEVE